VEPFLLGVPARRVQRGRRGIDAGHLAAETGEILRQDAAAATHVQKAFALWRALQHLREDALEIAETGGLDGCLEKVQQAVLGPPGAGVLIIDFVVDAQGRLPSRGQTELAASPAPAVSSEPARAYQGQASGVPK
jgi:hypothetical protein